MFSFLSKLLPRRRLPVPPPDSAIQMGFLGGTRVDVFAVRKNPEELRDLEEMLILMDAIEAAGPHASWNYG